MNQRAPHQFPGPEHALPAVLIVDDRTENLLALTAVLEELPIRVVCASSGADALARCDRDEFAVVVLDVMMPETDGPTTARELKARASGRLTPIIFLTAVGADRRRIHDGYAAGAVDYLFKPIDPDLLRDKVMAFVELYRNRRAEHWTQRRRYADQAAAARHDADQRFRLLADAAPVMVWTARPDGTLDYVSPFTTDYLGAPAERPLEGFWRDYVHPDDYAASVRRWEESLHGGTPYELEVRLWCAGRGSYRRHIARASPRRDASGAVIGWIGVNADVEDARHADEEAHALQLTAERAARIASDDARADAETERERLTFLLEAGAALAESLDYQETLQTLVRIAVPFLADYAMVDMVNERGIVERVAWAHSDRSMQQVLDQTSRQYNTFADAEHPVHGAMTGATSRIMPVMSDAVIRAIARSEEHLALIRRLDPRSVMAVPLTARGRTLGVMVFCMSASGRAYTSGDLALAEELVRRAAVAVDTARLYEAAQEANRAKAAFLAAVSHDLRQPLNASLGFLDIALMGIRGDVPSTLREDLERVRRNQQHLLALINDVLSFARIEAGQLLVRREVLSLADVLDALPALVSPQADARGIALSIMPCAPPLDVVGDHERIVQVFTNLLTNAIKATAPGGRVSVGCEAAGDLVLVHVRDTGVGIAPEMRERIFEPFVQVSRSLSRPEEGIGLGLPISRNLARAMGGELTVESTPGAGSTFTVRLPRAEYTAPSLVQAETPAQAL